MPVDGARNPTVTQVPQWHDFLQRELRYRFTWGLGSALAVAADGDPAELLTGGNQLPWAGVWIKDLLTWGTLDPAAAYSLARAVVDTRDEAAELAAAYYEGDIPEGTDPLDPVAIRIWAARHARPRARSESQDTEYPAAVVDRMDHDARRKTWRVLPNRAPDGGIESRPFRHRPRPLRSGHRSPRGPGRQSRLCPLAGRVRRALQIVRLMAPRRWSAPRADCI